MPPTAQKLDPSRSIKSLTVKLIPNDGSKPVGMRFSGDDLEYDDPAHVTALDRLADWIILLWQMEALNEQGKQN